MFNREELLEALVDAIRRTVVELPPDVEATMRTLVGEAGPQARLHLESALAEGERARSTGRPYCAVDSGFPVFFVKPSPTMPPDLPLIVSEAVAEATRRGHLRPSVADPFSGEVTPDNTGAGAPWLVYGPPGGAYTELVYVPNGSAADRLATIAHLRPPVSGEDVIGIVRTALSKGGRYPCQPVIVGIGIGGPADGAMALSKQALLRPLGFRSGDSRAEAMERMVLASINADGAGIGALALGVHIEFAAAHRATCPVSVSILCRAARRVALRISDTGTVQVIR